MNNNAMSLEKLREANEHLGNLDRLNTLLKDDGYLFFRGVLDLDEVKAVKNDFISVLQKQGVVKPGATEAIWSGAGIDNIDDSALYSLSSYLRLATSQGIERFAQNVFGEPVFMFRDANIRYALPGDSVHVTPAHQDYFFIRMNQVFRTVWIPLMDIDESMGGLAVACGSHKGGLRDHVEHESAESYIFRGRKQRGVRLDDIKEAWHTTDFRSGDLLMFDNLTIHRALPNRSDRVRLSIDTRCQPATATRTWQAEKTILEVRRIRQTSKRIATREGANDELFEALFIELMRRGLEPERLNIKGLMMELSQVSS